MGSSSPVRSKRARRSLCPFPSLQCAAQGSRHRKVHGDAKYESTAVKGTVWLAREQPKGLPTLHHLHDEQQARILSSPLTSFSFALTSFHVSFNSPAS